tara:strand:- start:45 stop:209 length:165 start_codon:yes stop_codon:yes gene_type:complete
MLKVKSKYLKQRPPHCKTILGEFTQKQLQALPDYLKNEYCVLEKKKEVKKDEKK